jgi:hypothetical protein
MTNEMLRPCIIKDISESPFDACIAEVFKDSEDLEAYILLREEKNRMCLFKHYVKCNSIEELDSMYNSWVCSLADALNGPVLAADAVLAGLPKDARAVLVDTIGIPHILDDDGFGWVWGEDGYDVMPYHKIQAFRCSKTAEYLRQFTLEGKRIKQKEMN